MFDKIGKIDKIKLWKKSNFKNCVYGLITTESSDLYNYLLNQRLFYGQTEFYCRQYFSKDQKDKYLEDLKFRRLFAKKIPKNLNDNDFLQIIRQHLGSVEKAYQIRRDKSKGMGYGYVELSFPSGGSFKIKLDPYREKTNRKTGKNFKDLSQRKQVKKGLPKSAQNIRSKQIYGVKKMHKSLLSEIDYSNYDSMPTINESIISDDCDNAPSIEQYAEPVQQEIKKLTKYYSEDFGQLPYMLQQEKYYQILDKGYLDSPSSQNNGDVAVEDTPSTK